jgi:type VI secretion system secreted protein Hcp
MAYLDRQSLIPVLILSLVISVVPLTGIGLNQRSGSVNGWLEDIFGGSKSESSSTIFAKFEAINGESTDEKHKDWIEIHSFEFSMAVPGSATGTSRTRGDVVANDIFITKSVDKSTPKLMEALTRNTVIGEVIIEVVRPTGDKDTFYRYKLTNVLVTSYQSGGEATGLTVGDVLSLNFEEIKVTYTEFDESTGSMKGNIEWTWRIEEAEA